MFFQKFLAITLLAFVGFAAAQIVGNATLSEETPGSETFCSSTCVISGKYLGVSQDFFNDYGCGTLVRLNYPATSNTPQTLVAPICFVCAGCTGEPNIAGQTYNWIGSTVVMGNFEPVNPQPILVSWDI
ncbi:hypothetical protein BOTBODRAFT_34197 [Botryobasidium botryosum FD-172 SS1]|uniref:Uncharacterized protein n=1 Tax=Botryobasidium botryosum (strain FD-172 SS1) TaxID=930990 RepID=A0A067MDF9_BOTB1|nr:hypothetical protein BOTBODRAFT_34197 [Botryobasidium botryosum FD-172 SS1]